VGRAPLYGADRPAAINIGHGAAEVAAGQMAARLGTQAARNAVRFRTVPVLVLLSGAVIGHQRVMPWGDMPDRRRDAPWDPGLNEARRRLRSARASVAAGQVQIEVSLGALARSRALLIELQRPTVGDGGALALSAFEDGAGAAGREAAAPRPICLVLEDQALIALALEADLEEAGFEVAGPFATAEDALRWLDDRAPAVALLDVQLRAGTCIELARELRRRGIPFAVCSGRLRDTAPPPELAGAPWLEKPVDRAFLLRTLFGLVPAAGAGRGDFGSPVPAAGPPLIAPLSLAGSLEPGGP